MRRRLVGCMAVVGSVALLLTVPRAWADDAQDARQLVEKAKLTVEQFQSDANMAGLRDLAKKTRACSGAQRQMWTAGGNVPRTRIEPSSKLSRTSGRADLQTR